MINWEKIDAFTGEHYTKNNKNSGWNIVDYISGDMRIWELPNGQRQLTKGDTVVGTFKTLKAAKAFAETI